VQFGPAGSDSTVLVICWLGMLFSFLWLVGIGIQTVVLELHTGERDKSLDFALAIHI
jgi:hypothetical protein